MSTETTGVRDLLTGSGNVTQPVGSKSASTTTARFTASLATSCEVVPSTSLDANMLRRLCFCHVGRCAEVLWALKVTTSYYSSSSCEDIGILFRTMFPDCRIAEQEIEVIR